LVRGIRQQNRGFGIFSCQLPFDGQIDRLTPEIRDVAYHGKRRLYLLFFGHRAVVERFARALKTELQQQLIDVDALILSPRIINRPFDFENGHIDRLVGVGRLNPTFTRNDTKLLAIQPFSDAIDESIQLSFPLDRPEDSVVLTPPAIEVAPSAFIWRSNGWAEVPLGKMNLKNEIKIEQVNRDRIQQRLTFNMAITAPTFSQRGWYYLDLSFRSKIRDLTLPDWVADADLPRSKSFENGWDPSAFKGRTPGLREYIESIQGAISDESEEIGNLRILLERN
jgi:hypothetical protein